MAILTVYQYGAESLRNISLEIDKKEIKSKEFRRFVRDMLETMYLRKGVGLTAPQVGVNKRVIVIDVDWPTMNRNPMVLINPKIVYREGQMIGEEGSLSFRGSGDVDTDGVQLKTVKRSSKIKVNYTDLESRRLSIEANGNLLSRCLQHEIDHLDGILFIDRVENRDQAREELLKYGFSVHELHQ